MLGFAFVMMAAGVAGAMATVGEDDARAARLEAAERIEAARAAAAVLWEAFRAAETARSSDYWARRDAWLRAHSKVWEARAAAAALGVW